MQVGHAGFVGRRSGFIRAPTEMRSIVMLESCFRLLRLLVLGFYKINKEGDNLGSGKISPVVLVTSRSGIEHSMQNKITPSPVWEYKKNYSEQQLWSKMNSTPA